MYVTANHRIIIFCGNCDQPRIYHENGITGVCKRKQDSIIPNGQDLKAYVTRSFRLTTTDADGNRIPATNPFVSTTEDVKAVVYNDYVSPDLSCEYVTYFEDYSGPEASCAANFAVRPGPKGSFVKYENRILLTDEYGNVSDEHDYSDNTRPNEWEKVDRWNDHSYRENSDGSKSWDCTTTIDSKEVGEVRLNLRRINGVLAKQGTYLGKVSTESIDRTRNVYIDGNDGFVSQELYNLELTEKYQNRLLNVFADKNGRLGIGSIRIFKNADGTITAKCVQDRCPTNGEYDEHNNWVAKPNPGLTVNPSTLDRTGMESFVQSIITHGNNHAANWFKTKTTKDVHVLDYSSKEKSRKVYLRPPTVVEPYYKIHREGCNFSVTDPNRRCSNSKHYCMDTTAPVVKDDEEGTDLLVDHFRNCKTPGCNCTELLMKVGA